MTNRVVNLKPVGNGQAVLKYLAPYVYRVAISDSRIARVDDQRVTYRVKPSGCNHWKTRTLDGPRYARVSRPRTHTDRRSPVSLAYDLPVRSASL